MAVPSYTTDLSTFNAVTTSTNFIELSGYTSGSKEGIDPDLAIYGTVCMSASNRSAAPCSLGYTGTAMTLATDEAVFVWQKFFAPNSLATEANGGIVVGVGNASGAYYKWTFDGSDSYAYGGWKNYAVDPTKTTGRTTVGSPSGVWSAVGVGWDMINGISKGNALTLDIIRYGRGESIFTGGQAANYATFDGYATVNDNPTTGRFGLIQKIDGGYLYKGLMSLGTGTLVDMRDSNVNITIDNTKHVSASFNRIEVNNASSNIEWDAINFTAIGTVSKGQFEMIDNATVSMTACSFSAMDTFIFQSNATVSSTFTGCGQITHGGADMSLSTIRSSSVVANASALLYNLAVDPDGEMDGMEFTMGTTSTHAIEFGTNVPSSMTLRDCDFIGYGAGNNANDSTFHFKDTAGTITLNIVGGSGNVSYRTDGATIVIVQDPVTTSVHAVTTAGVDIQDARVLLKAADATGDLPYREAVTITRSGTTATVTHTAHGFVTNNYTVINNATQQEYNKVAQVTVINANSYTYQVSGSPTTPATGSPISTGVIVYGLTSVAGLISDSRTISTDQPVAGWTRKSTTAPFYKSTPITGTVSSTGGLALTSLMISDE